MTVHEYPRHHGSLSGLSDTDHHTQYALDEQGLRSARPLPGRRGRLYFATDLGVYYRDTGTSWVTFNAAAPVTITAEAATVVPLTLRLANGQTNNALEVRDNGGALLAAFTAAGSLSLPVGNIGIDHASGSLSISNTARDGYIFLNTDFNTQTSGAARLGSRAVGETVLAVYGKTGQTADLQSWGIGSTLMSGVDAAGRVNANRGLRVTQNAASLTGLAAGGAHNSLMLHQWVDGGGFGHGLVSLGYSGSGRSIQFGTQNGSDYATSSFLEILTVLDTHKVSIKGSGASGNGNNIFEVRRGNGAILTQVRDTETAGYTRLEVDVASIGMKAFVVGAVDSGGAGFRSVRMVN